MSTIPEIDLTSVDVLRDPFTAYSHARERSPLVRLRAPGFGPLWALTRHGDARALLSDPRLRLSADSYQRPPGIPEHCLAYMRTMAEMNGPEHSRLRRLVSPAFTARRAAEFRPRLESIVTGLLDSLDEHIEGASVDLLAHFAKPLPMEVICALVGIPESERPRWREYGAAVMSGSGETFVAAIPGIMDGAQAAIADRRREPGNDLLDDLIRTQAEDGDRLHDAEMVTLVWHLVLAGQTPTNLIANVVDALLSQPQQLAILRADPGLLPGAVEELTRWCGPALLTVPRHTSEDVEVGGQVIPVGEAVTVALAATNRDPRVFTDPDQLDLRRPPGPPGHLGFSHGPHYCLGATLARLQTEVALAALLQRFPRLALANPDQVRRVPDPGTWRLSSVPVTY